MFRLAHLSDPHVPPGQRPRRRELLSQRVIGWANWRRSRHRVHRRDVLDMITGDLARAGVDHIAVTGDLTIVSSRAEWEACRKWLATLGTGADVSLVPGNHDAYTRRAVPGTARAWKDYMSDDAALAEYTSAEFPYLRRRGPLAIVGCSSAVATAPFLATGRVGRHQTDRIEALLDGLRETGLFRVVLIHHPPLRGPGDRYRRLTDWRRFAAMLERAGAELVLHGHDHVATVRWLAGPAGGIPVVGVPSASALAHRGKPAAQYNIYGISGAPGMWTCRLTARGFDGAAIHTTGTQELWQDGRALSGEPVRTR
jgi:3',5'-cyclic AMP phosphodiesterase CpdA